MARPREFDEDKVLQEALRVFWEKGYDSASLNDLLDAMGLTKSSLYQAFGSKYGLFQKVRSRYYDKYLGFRQEALNEPTPRRIVERLLFGMSNLQTAKSTPPGCLETNSALACSSEGEPIWLELAKSRETFRLQLRDRLMAVRDAGPLPAGMNCDDASALVLAIVHGLAVQSKAGLSREASRRIVRAALLSWPTE